MTWVGLKSRPEIVNYKLVVLVFRSLIIWPNLPTSLVDYYYSSILLCYSKSILSCSACSWSFLAFSIFCSLRLYSYLLLFSNYLFLASSRSCSYLILLISRTRVVLGSITSIVFFILFGSVMLCKSDIFIAWYSKLSFLNIWKLNIN